LEVVRERWIGAAPDVIWPLVDDPARLSEWFSFAERIEALSGTGVGRRQRLHGRWGKKRSEVDQLITAHEPPRLLQWRHEAERLDGKPAPQFARETVFTIHLEPSDAGTTVRLHSRQEPASVLKGFVMRLFGSREIAQHLDRSLGNLTRLATAGTPSS
jgi:uncharacterized protein YndB with AHSA1/START domain